MCHTSDMKAGETQRSLPARILGRIDSESGKVWTPTDFADLGPRDTVDKALQRMARSDEIRRVERGLYDKPRTSKLTQKSQYRIIEPSSKLSHGAIRLALSSMA